MELRSSNIATICLLIVILSGHVTNAVTCFHCYSAGNGCPDPFNSNGNAVNVISNCNVCVKVVINGETSRFCGDAPVSNLKCVSRDDDDACFCDTDYCNHAHHVTSHVTLPIAAILLHVTCRFLGMML